MMRGLEGRRIALVALDEDPANGIVAKALEQAGAQLDPLSLGKGTDTDWHGGKYAALVVSGGAADRPLHDDPRLVQLVREFLASEKPVAVLGNALRVVLNAGGAAGRTVAATGRLKAIVEAAGGKPGAEPLAVDGSLVTATGADVDAFASRVVQEFSRCLEEHEVDGMSEQSFPASDPPSTTPGSVGHVAPDRDSGSPA
jgi:putative intracellular protease/amidase